MKVQNNVTVKDQDGNSSKPMLADDVDMFAIFPFETATDEQKEELLRGFTELTAKHSLQIFKSLGLKHHFECMVIDEDTKEEYILSFYKSRSIIR